MLLSHALRLKPNDVVTLTGGGGKTAVMFCLAEELSAASQHVVTTMTTRIFTGQMARAPAHLVLQETGTLPETTREALLLGQLPEALAQRRHVLVAGGVVVAEDKVQGIPPELVDQIAGLEAVDAVIVEADGSRRLPLKAPASHEPVVPASTTVLTPIAGLDAIGRPITTGQVHRPELIARLAGAQPGDPVTPEVLAAVLAHPDGGAKGLPPGARLVPLLNKADGEETLPVARDIARLLLAVPRVDSVVVAAVEGPNAAARPAAETWGRVAAIVLAAGRSARFGAGRTLKQTLPWRGRPLVAHVAAQALACPDIDRVLVTVGADAARVADALRNGLGPDEQARLELVRVPAWEQGQSRSVQAGLRAALAPGPRGPVTPSQRAISAVLFLLADQPGVTPALLAALVQWHRETLAPVVAPRHAGQRGNPVLFDAATFAEFAKLGGDAGARSIIQAHIDEVEWLDWPTPEILQDIDTPADFDLYASALAADTSPATEDTRRETREDRTRQPNDDAT